MELKETAEAVQSVWVGKDVRSFTIYSCVCVIVVLQNILIIASDKTERGHSTLWRGYVYQHIS